MKRLGLLILLAALLLTAQTALAHALLLRSIPEANAAIDRAPAQVELLFSERLDGSFSKIAVLDSTGKTVDKEPKWRTPGTKLTTGATRTW